MRFLRDDIIIRRDVVMVVEVVYLPVSYILVQAVAIDILEVFSSYKR